LIGENTINKQKNILINQIINKMKEVIDIRES